MPASLTASADLDSAYLLLSHGSRDPRPAIAVEHLAKLVAQRLQAIDRVNPVVSTLRSVVSGTRSNSSPTNSTFPLIGTAVLELAPQPLHEQIQQFARYAQMQGYRTIQILPLFLLPGMHVMEDTPAEVALAQQSLPDVTLNIRAYLGSHPDLKNLLINPVDPIATNPTAGKVLLAHGTRRPEGNQSVEKIATRLGAIPAYWSVAPSLETQMTKLVKQGCQQIAILPYFLFEGGITDAIEQETHRLAQQFPYVQLHLARPLGATPQLADLVVDLMH